MCEVCSVVPTGPVSPRCPKCTRTRVCPTCSKYIEFDRCPGCTAISTVDPQGWVLAQLIENHMEPAVFKTLCNIAEASNLEVQLKLRRNEGLTQAEVVGLVNASGRMRFTKLTYEKAPDISCDREMSAGKLVVQQRWSAYTDNNPTFTKDVETLLKQLNPKNTGMSVATRQEIVTRMNDTWDAAVGPGWRT